MPIPSTCWHQNSASLTLYSSWKTKVLQESFRPSVAAEDCQCTQLPRLSSYPTLVWSTVPCSQTSAFPCEQDFWHGCLPSPPSPKVRSLRRYGECIWGFSPAPLVCSPPAMNRNRGCTPSCFVSFSPAFHPSSPNATHHGLSLTTLAASAAPSCSQTCSSRCRATCSFSIHTVRRHSIRVKISRQMSAGI